MEHLEIQLNGETAEVEEGATLSSLLADRGLNPKSVLIECNGEAVFRRKWDETVCRSGDVIEIFKVVAGG